jgi:hypothetical protein
MNRYDLKDVFHIESDVLIYDNLIDVWRRLKAFRMDTKLVAVQDSKDRAICSIVFFPNTRDVTKFTSYITKTVREGQFLNDMELMGMYRDKFCFPDSPDHQLAGPLGIYDACAIGQYLGGVDMRNIPPGQIKSRWINPTRGFINETSVFKANRARYLKAKMNGNLEYRGKKYISGPGLLEGPMHEIIALHLHSKQLYLFSSVFDIQFEDIITGDRIVASCDWVIVDYAQFLYNRNLMKHNQRVILVKDFKNVNRVSLDKFMEETGKTTIKLFVYIDIMPQFEKWILPILPTEFRYIIYSHNGDYAFDSRFRGILEDPKVERIYAQNLDLDPHMYPKAELLPIGLANDIFPHGNLDALYARMVRCYRHRKESSIYININESTHPFRRQVMNAIRSSGRKWTIVDRSCPFEEYLEELSRSRFSLCLRGNGLDTHRFWESLYLGVIPVVVYHPTMSNFIKHLRKNLIPFYMVESLEFFRDQDEYFFTEDIYTKTLYKSGVNVSTFAMSQLRLLER